MSRAELYASVDVCGPEGGGDGQLVTYSADAWWRVSAACVHTRWDVPSTIYWYVSGEHYIGTLVVRHRLTPELTEVGGHVGYHVVAPWQSQGHATRMLAAGLVECRRLGIDRVLLTCATDNEPSRRVILANGGVPDGRCRGEDRYWITLTRSKETDPSDTADGS